MSIQLKTVLTKDEADFIKSAQNLAHNTRYGIERAWWRAGKNITGEFNRAVKDKTTKTGRIYFLKNPGGKPVKHQASAPGETPAGQPPRAGGGRYRKGIAAEVRGEHELAIGNDAPHALWLEVGTTRMRARPGLANAIKASERDTKKFLYEEIEEAL